MGKHIARLSMLCVVGAIALAPAAEAYKVPPITGGSKTSQKSTKSVAKGLQSKTGKKLAKGLTVEVHFPAAGTMSCTVKGGGKKIGSGKASATKAGGKKLKITFTGSGKSFLKTGAGKNVTVSCTFKPTSGKSSTSSVTVKLG